MCVLLGEEVQSLAQDWWVVGDHCLSADYSHAASERVFGNGGYESRGQVPVRTEDKRHLWEAFFRDHGVHVGMRLGEKLAIEVRGSKVFLPPVGILAGFLVLEEHVVDAALALEANRPVVERLVLGGESHLVQRGVRGPSGGRA